MLRVVASLGILFGPWPEDFAGDEGFEAPAPVLRIAKAPTVDLVTLVGRCSEEVTPRDPVVWDDFSLLRTGTTPKAGSTSSSSSSESRASRLATGVFRGWPGGTMVLAFAAAVAVCRLGVTGGRFIGI